MMTTMRTVMRCVVGTTALMIAIGGLVLAAQEPKAPQPVTNQDLLAGLKNPGRWLIYQGDYNGQRHSPLKQLTPQNVARLVPQDRVAIGS